MDSIMVRDFLLQINFHEKIKFDISEASKMLEIIYEREKEDNSNKVVDLNKNSIFGPNKVTALLNWLKGFQWILYQKDSGYILTDLGKCIVKYDLELNNPVTHFVMHYHLCKNSIFWDFFVSKFLISNSYFSKQILISEIQNEFKINKQNDATKHIKPLFDFYSNDVKVTLFEKDILSSDEQYTFLGVTPPNLFALLYCLNDWWAIKSSENNSILRSELIDNKESFAEKIGMQKSELINWLGKLHQMQFIYEHLAVAPYTIDKKWNLNNLELIQKAYEQ